jgi:hypothetical protein
VIDDRTLGRVMPRGMVALTGDLVRASAWMLVVVLLLTFAGVYARLAGLLFAKPGANDFTILYYTARMADDGFQMYGNLPTEYGLDWKAPHLGNLNPPHFQLLVAPLVPLGYRGALVAWLVANVLIVAACAWIVVRELRPALTLKRMLLATLLVFASAAWTSVAVTGEMSLLLLLPCTGAWVAARRGRWEVAGVLLGVAASLKVFLLVFGAWLIVARRWRAAAWMAAGAIVPFALGVAVYGDMAYIAWLHRLSHVGWWWLPMNLSLRGMADRVFVAHGPFAAVFAAPAVVQPAWLVAALVVVAVTAWRTWPARGVDVDRVFATLLVAALLVSPLGWIYYLPLATAPVVALAIRRELSGPGPLRVALAAIALAFLYVPVEVTERGQPSALATLGLACAHGWGALLLWVRLVLRDAPPAAGSAA